MKKNISTAFFFALVFLQSSAQTVLQLYPAGIPNSKESIDQEKRDSSVRSGVVIISKISRPTLTVFLPPKKKQLVQQ